jgi:glutathione S-transferase
MLLYDHPLGPNPRRVRIFLAEKGVTIPTQTIDIAKGGARSVEFREKNAFGGVPVLELDDGSHIAESVAICRYIEATHPEPALFGRTPKEQALIEMWLRRIELHLMMPIGQVWVHGHKLTAHLLKQIPEAAEQNRKRCAISYKLFDDALAQSTFIAGEDYTVCDAVALATLDFGWKLVGVPADDALVNLKRWHEAVSARPSAMA